MLMRILGKGYVCVEPLGVLWVFIILGYFNKPIIQVKAKHTKLVKALCHFYFFHFFGTETRQNLYGSTVPFLCPLEINWNLGTLLAQISAQEIDVENINKNKNKKLGTRFDGWGRTMCIMRDSIFANHHHHIHHCHKLPHHCRHPHHLHLHHSIEEILLLICNPYMFLSFRHNRNKNGVGWPYKILRCRIAPKM